MIQLTCLFVIFCRSRLLSFKVVVVQGFFYCWNCYTPYKSGLQQLSQMPNKTFYSGAAFAMRH